MEKESTRQRLLEAAKRVFAQKGYHAAGVSDIIEAAGVARGTFYLYFDSKRDVFNALVEYIIGQVDEMMTALPLDEPEKIVPHLKSLVLKVYEFFENDPDLATLIIREATSLDAQSWERLNEAISLLADWIVSYLKQGRKYGVLRKFNPRIFAFMFLGAIRELLMQYTITGFLHAELEEMVETLIDTFLFGVLEEKYRVLVTTKGKRRRTTKKTKGGES